jgi:hypothetical protein
VRAEAARYAFASKSRLGRIAWKKKRATASTAWVIGPASDISSPLGWSALICKYGHRTLPSRHGALPRSPSSSAQSMHAGERVQLCGRHVRGKTRRISPTSVSWRTISASDLSVYQPWAHKAIERQRRVSSRSAEQGWTKWPRRRSGSQPLNITRADGFVARSRHNGVFNAQSYH